jgi:hypothetical protein
LLVAAKPLQTLQRIYVSQLLWSLTIRLYLYAQITKHQQREVTRQARLRERTNSVRRKMKGVTFRGWSPTTQTNGSRHQAAPGPQRRSHKIHRYPISSRHHLPYLRRKSRQNAHRLGQSTRRLCLSWLTTLEDSI